MEPERILDDIDAQKASQEQAELSFLKSLAEVGEFVTAVAANELSYELASTKPLHELVDLPVVAEEITDGRTSLQLAVEEAILRRKEAFRAEHEQRVLRHSLTEGVEEN